jgi:aspartyl-tRNA(Asn)/glutamyl-tRNA(Gln) amidotransferase subunit A
VQIIAAPWREDIALRIAHALEQAGAVAATRPSLAPDKRARTRN